jgi:hypothetical protein
MYHSEFDPAEKRMSEADARTLPYRNTTFSSVHWQSVYDPTEVGTIVPDMPPPPPAAYLAALEPKPLLVKQEPPKEFIMELPAKEQVADKNFSKKPIWI